MFNLSRTLFLRNRNIHVSDVHSCAIDSLVEISRYAIIPFLPNSKEIDCGPLLMSLKRLVNKIEATELDLNRQRHRTDKEWNELLYVHGKKLTGEINDVWNILLQELPKDFGPKGRIDAMIDQVHIPLTATDDEKELFNLTRTLSCPICKVGQTVSEVITVEFQNKDFNASLWNTVYGGEKCKNCDSNTDVRIDTLPEILLIKPYSSERKLNTNQNGMEEIELHGRKYRLNGLIKHQVNHFIAIVNRDGKWLILNDVAYQISIHDSLKSALQQVNQEMPFYGLELLAYNLKPLINGDLNESGSRNVRAWLDC